MYKSNVGFKKFPVYQIALTEQFLALKIMSHLPLLCSFLDLAPSLSVVRKRFLFSPWQIHLQLASRRILSQMFVTKCCWELNIHISTYLSCLSSCLKKRKKTLFTNAPWTHHRDEKERRVFGACKEGCGRSLFSHLLSAISGTNARLQHTTNELICQ